MEHRFILCCGAHRSQASVEVLPTGRVRVTSLAAVNPTLVIRAGGGDQLDEVLLHQGQRLCVS